MSVFASVEQRPEQLVQPDPDWWRGAVKRVARNLGWLFNRVLYPGTRDGIEMTQEELALLAGVSRPLVNRALQELEADGLLRLERGVITVLDHERLARYEA